MKNVISRPKLRFSLPGVLFLIALAQIIAVAVFSTAGRSNEQLFIENPAEAVIPASAFFQRFPEKRKSSSQVDLGLYVDSLYELEMAALTFKVRGWLWYKWSRMPLIEGSVDPGQMGYFDFNFQDEANIKQEVSSKIPVVEVKDSGDIGYWNETSFDAKLSAPGLNFRNFPFDHQKLSILVTNPIHESDELTYKITQFRLPSRVFNIPNYRLEGISFADEIRVYTSNFSDDRSVSWENDSATTQSQATFNIYISRNPLTSLLEYVIPLAIASFLGVVVVTLKPELWEVKLATPPAAILSLIFLQDSFAEDLPRVQYLTCMDLMFFLGYFCCLLSFIDGLLTCQPNNAKKIHNLAGVAALGIFALTPLFISFWLSAPLKFP